MPTGRNGCRWPGTGADSVWNGCRQILEVLSVYLGIITSVVAQLAKRENVDFDSMYVAFCGSLLYERLVIPETLLWSESTEFLVDQYYKWLPTSVAPNEGTRRDGLGRGGARRGRRPLPPRPLPTQRQQVDARPAGLGDRGREAVLWVVVLRAYKYSARIM